MESNIADMQHQDLDHKVLLTDRWPSIIHAKLIMSWLHQRIKAEDWNYRISVDIISFTHKQDAIAFSLTFPDIIRK